tara:strand:- start:556 stop:804 length:249 start_codon:yes stop_codon:yes gene_type:complete
MMSGQRIKATPSVTSSRQPETRTTQPTSYEQHLKSQPLRKRIARAGRRTVRRAVSSIVKPTEGKPQGKFRGAVRRLSGIFKR